MSGDDRPHDPSQKRLDDARARGEIPHSPDLTAAAALAGFVLALWQFGPAAMAAMGNAAMAGLAQADRAAVVGPILQGMLRPILPVLLMPAVAALAALMAQRAIAFVPDRLAPKLSRINPVATLGHRFGPQGLADFARSMVKMVLVAITLYLVIRSQIGTIIGTSAASPAQSVLAMGRMVFGFLAAVVALSVTIGLVDLLWQIRSHRARLRMTLQEVKDEHRESEGDPHAKAQRRARGQEIATNRMLRDVEQADVIIVNPTHYAVALVWQRHKQMPPVLLAKGTDEIAARIRERAAEYGVPIRRDPPTARAIHAGVEIGQPIRPEHYRAVAAAIRFAETMRKRAGQRPRL